MNISIFDILEQFPFRCVKFLLFSQAFLVETPSLGSSKLSSGAPLKQFGDFVKVPMDMLLLD